MKKKTLAAITWQKLQINKKMGEFVTIKAVLVFILTLFY